MSCCCACAEGEALDPVEPAALPRQSRCPKCASGDLHLNYAANEYACSYSRRTGGVTRPCNSVRGEHMEVHCRGCGFGWNEEPLDSLSGSQVG